VSSVPNMSRKREKKKRKKDRLPKTCRKNPLLLRGEGGEDTMLSSLTEEKRKKKKGKASTFSKKAPFQANDRLRRKGGTKCTNCLTFEKKGEKRKESQCRQPAEEQKRAFPNCRKEIPRRKGEKGKAKVIQFAQKKRRGDCSCCLSKKRLGSCSPGADQKTTPA